MAVARLDRNVTPVTQGAAWSRERITTADIQRSEKHER